jgi:hypothetical protein
VAGRQRKVAGRSRKVARRPAHVAIPPPLCTKVVVVELRRMLVEMNVVKEGVGSQLATHFGWSAKPWPPLSPNFLHPPRLVPLVLKPLTESIKSKAISLHFFQRSFYLFLFFEIFDFMTCNDGKQKHAVQKE